MNHIHGIQDLIRLLESNKGSRAVWIFAAILALAGLMVWYDGWSYRGFSAPEAMEAAQVGRNLAEGHGFTTLSLSPFQMNVALNKHPGPEAQTNFSPPTGNFYPDQINPPVYPVVLAGLMKVIKPRWTVELKKSFWSSDGRFQRYQPEVAIAVFNQLLLMVAVVMTFFLARSWFDRQAAWLAAVVTLGSSALWQFSVSGLSTLLLLVIFLGLILCLTRLESLARTQPSAYRQLVILALAAGGLTGLGLLTRYAFGWLILPVLVFLGWFGGPRRGTLAGLAGLMFFLVAAPWLARNYSMSGDFFGRAGYAVLEGTRLFPGMTLEQSSHPDLSGAWFEGGWLSLIMPKLIHNSLAIFKDDLPHLGGWAAMLFFTGLLLNFRNPAPRRFRVFTLACLALLVLVQALGRTWRSDLTPDLNSENLLVLLTPLIVIFGIAFFITLLDQLNLPGPEVRYAATVLLVGLLCLPFIAGFLPPKPRPLAFPPYYPPEIQQVSGWLKPDELMMSDVPWAVAWYGRHACITLARNTQDDFSAINDYFQPVRGVYLTSVTLDDKFFSKVLRSEPGGWDQLIMNFVIKDAVDRAGESSEPDPLSRINILPKAPVDYLNGFPLRKARSLEAGVFLTDRERWPQSR